MNTGIAHHHEQRYPNGCVAACICMALKWRGAQFDEEFLHASASAKGHSFRWILQALRCQSQDYLAPSQEELLASAPIWLADGCVLIAKVNGPSYVRRCGTQPAGRPSQHGELASAGQWGGPFHALLVVERTNRGFGILDPYYPPDGQPIELSDETRLDIFACEVVVVR